MAAFPGILATKVGPTTPLTINMLQDYNPYFSPNPDWALGLIATVTAGSTLTYNVEITGDDAPSNGGNWNAHDTLFNLTISANGNIAFPVTGIRLNVTQYTNGSVNLGVVKWP